jgi:hypothetical protein
VSSFHPSGMPMPTVPLVYFTNFGFGAGGSAAEPAVVVPTRAKTARLQATVRATGPIVDLRNDTSKTLVSQSCRNRRLSSVKTVLNNMSRRNEKQPTCQSTQIRPTRSLAEHRVVVTRIEIEPAPGNVMSDRNRVRRPCARFAQGCTTSVGKTVPPNQLDLELGGVSLHQQGDRNDAIEGWGN